MINLDFDVLFSFIYEQIILIGLFLFGSAQVAQVNPQFADTIASIPVDSTQEGFIATGLPAIWNVLVWISVPTIVTLVAIILYVYIRKAHVEKVIASVRKTNTLSEYGRIFLPAEDRSAISASTHAFKQRFERVIRDAHTDNPNDWRHAIIEADIMLDEMLSAQGYHGDTMADKMKQVEKSDFNTIDLAWDAHKVRNRVAHDGSAHDLSEREVKRVVNLYKEVFREFHLL